MVFPFDYRMLFLLGVIILLGGVFPGVMLANTDLTRIPYRSLTPPATLDLEAPRATRVPASDTPRETPTGPVRGISPSEMIIITLVGVILGLVIGIFLVRPTIYPGPF